jgi:uncharacterized membrane protein
LNHPVQDATSTSGLDQQTASALAYLAGPLSGILLLIAERANRTVRFHAWQSILGLGGVWTVGCVLYVLAFGALFVSANAFRALLWLAILVWAGLIVLWVVCVLKAYKGERFRLPLVSDYAERLTTPNATPNS